MFEGEGPMRAPRTRLAAMGGLLIRSERLDWYPPIDDWRVTVTKLRSLRRNTKEPAPRESRSDSARAHPNTATAATFSPLHSTNLHDDVVWGVAPLQDDRRERPNI